MLNNIVDNLEQCGQQNIVHGCFHQARTGCSFFAVIEVVKKKYCQISSTWEQIKPRQGQQVKENLLVCTRFNLSTNWDKS